MHYLNIILWICLGVNAALFVINSVNLRRVITLRKQWEKMNKDYERDLNRLKGFNAALNVVRPHGVAVMFGKKPPVH